MKTILIALACSAIVVPAAATTSTINPIAALATLHVQQTAQDTVPQLQKARLTEVVFGSVPSIKVKIGEEIKTYLISSSTAYNLSGQDKNLTGVYRTCLNQEVYLLSKKSDAGIQVQKIWDYTSWLAYTTKHKGAQFGAVKYFNNRFLAIAELTYNLNDQTKYVKAGKTVARKKLEGITPLWVSGDVKDGMPIALIVSDSPSGVNAQTGTGSSNTRPPSTGGGTRPASTGTGGTGGGSGISPTEQGNGTRPPSTGTGGTGGSSGVSPTERGNGTRPPSTGSGSQSPTERGNSTRPDSTGTKTYSPTEKAAILKRGLMVQLYFTILDSSDMITNAGAPGEVLNAVAEKVGTNDNKVEIFGLLRFNGQKLWEIERKSAVKRAKNERLNLVKGNLNYFTLNTEKLKLKGYIKDDDNLSFADMIAEVDLQIDILGQMSKGWKEFKLPGNKAKLNVLVAPMPEKR